jgi:hypothetical protein
MKLELTEYKNGVIKYHFDDLVTVVTDDDDDVVLINGKATAEHFTEIVNRCHLAGLAWSELLRSDAAEDLTLV